MKQQPILAVRPCVAVEAPPSQRPKPERQVRRRVLLQLLALMALSPASALATESAAGVGRAGAGTTAGGGGNPRRILIVGDSLSAEYGIGRGEGWVKLLEQRTQPRGWTIVNASISGETTVGGVTRLPTLLERNKPAITVIELGANDALRGLPMASTEANLRKMILLARESGSKPLLVGMMMPPNFGPAYARQFSEMFGHIARTEKIALVPFLLEGFADDLSWFQPDRVHPTAKAQPRMLDNVWPVLNEML
ncbi:MAG TPA: arylesterase [Lautropia sp.]|nr:arylesterase [Lautropia sp.]